MRYILSCDMVQPLRTETEAESEDQALDILDQMLEDGAMPEDEDYPIGYIRNKKAVRVALQSITDSEDLSRFIPVNKLDMVDALELAINELTTLGYNGLVIDKLEEQLKDIRAKA